MEELIKLIRSIVIQSIMTEITKIPIGSKKVDLDKKVQKSLNAKLSNIKSIEINPLVIKGDDFGYKEKLEINEELLN